MPAVEISDVTKTFGDVTAVDNLSLTVPAGSVYGFIGPNGSGKSTTNADDRQHLLPGFRRHSGFWENPLPYRLGPDWVSSRRQALLDYLDKLR